MKFTLSRASATAVAQQLMKTCNAKNEKSRLDGYIYFEVCGGEGPNSPNVLQKYLTAATTNGAADQIVIVPTVSLAAEIGEGFFVEASLFSEFLKTFSHDDVSCLLNKKNEFLIGSAAKNTFLTLPTINKDGYTPVHFTSKGTPFTLDGKALGKALRLTAFSAGMDPKKPAITAVKLCIDGAKLVAVSTDNSRASRVSLEIEDTGVKAELLVPRVSAEILGQLLVNVDVVTLEQGRNHLRVAWEGTTFTTALEMSGAKYPQVEIFYSRTLHATTRLSRGELLSALKVTGLIAKDTYVRMDLDPSSGLMLSAKQRNGTNSEITVVVQEADKQADAIVAFKHLKAAVDIFGTAFLEVQFREVMEDTLAPVLVDGEGFEHIVFPMEPNDDEGEGDNEGEGE